MSQFPDSDGLLDNYLATLKACSHAANALHRHPNFNLVIDSMLETRGIDSEIALELLLDNPNPLGLDYVHGLVLNAIDGTDRAGIFLALRLFRDLPPGELAKKISGLLPTLFQDFNGSHDDEAFRRQDLLEVLLEFGTPDDVMLVAAWLKEKTELDDRNQLLLTNPRAHDGCRKRNRESR